MAITLNGDTLEITGTQIDIPATLNIAGITRTTEIVAGNTSVNVFEIDSSIRQINIIGDLTLNLFNNRLVPKPESSKNPYIVINGSLTVNNTDSTGVSVTGGAALDLSRVRNFGQIILANGDFNVTGGILPFAGTSGRLNLQSSNINFIDCEVVCMGGASTIDANGSNNNYNNVVFEGFQLRTNNPLGFAGISNLEYRRAETALLYNQATNIDNVTLSGLSAKNLSGAVLRLENFSRAYLRLKNSGAGNDTQIASNFSQANKANSKILITNTLNLSALDTSSNPVIGANLYAKDVDNGERYAENYGQGQSYEVLTTQDIEYSQVSDLGGQFSFDVISAVKSIDGTTDNRGLNNSANLEFFVYDYGFFMSSVTPDLSGLGEKNARITLVTNPSVALTKQQADNLSVTVSYQSNNLILVGAGQLTTSNVYDAIAAEMADNFTAVDRLLTLSNDELNAENKNLNIIIDGFTLVGSLSVSNSNTITLQNSGAITGLISDSTGKNNLISITGLTDSNVQIINSLNQVLDRQENVSGEYIYATDIGVSGAHKIIINRLGYSANVIDVNLQGQSYSFNGSLSQNLTPSGAPMYSGSGAGLLSFQLSNEGNFYRLAIFNNSVTAQNVYDQSENFLMSEVGMSHLANGGGNVTFASLPTGNFLFLGDNVQLLRSLPEDDSATVEAFVTSTQGTVLDSSNGSVQFVTVTRAQQLTEYSGFIWVDLINGVDENQYPAGTPSRPTNSIQNAKVLADFFGINSVKISGDQTALPQKLSGLSLISDTSQAANSVLLPTLIFSELADLNNCVIDSFALTGSFDVSTDVIGNEYKECLIHNVNGLTGFARKCKISGAIQVEQSLDLVDCYGSFFLLASGSNSNVTIPSYSGFVTIAGMTSSDATISMSLTSGTVTIDESCTSGSILIFTDNDKFVIDNSSGATVTVLASELSGGNGQGGQQITPADIWGYDLSLITSSNTAASELKDAKQNTINILNDVQQIPTTPLLSADYIAPDNAGIQAIKTKTDTLQNTDLSLIAEKTDIQNQTNDLKGAGNKDLTEVFNNTPDVNLTPVLDAVNGLNDFDPSADTVARVSLVDVTSALTDYVEPDNAGIAVIRADTGQINQITDLLQLIKKYHDNKTEFLNENKTQKVTQQNAHHIVIYDDDGITPIKEISFLDSSGNSSNLINAAGYIKS